jgi:hypothetical protein
MQRRRVGSRPDLVLATVADLDTARVPALREHGARGGAIGLALAGVPMATAVRAEMRINASARDCGCETGSRVATVALFVVLLVAYLRFDSVVPHGVTELAQWVGVVLLGALAGKAWGILRARRRLASELSRLRNIAVGA